MKYETPKLTALTPAIGAIQNVTISKLLQSTEDSDLEHCAFPAYNEWE